MELSDATEETPATLGIDSGTFRIVAQFFKLYATPGPPSCLKIFCKNLNQIITFEIKITGLRISKNNNK
jgi:hypothetical protein